MIVNSGKHVVKVWGKPGFPLVGFSRGGAVGSTYTAFVVGRGRLEPQKFSLGLANFDSN